MLDAIPNDQRDLANERIKKAAAELGIPYDQARRILYWHARRKNETASLERIQTWLQDLHAIVRAYNQAIALQELRRNHPVSPQAEELPA